MLLLVDASIPLQVADLDVANWLGEAEVRRSVIPVPISCSDFVDLDQRQRSLEDGAWRKLREKRSQHIERNKPLRR